MCVLSSMRLITCPDNTGPGRLVLTGYNSNPSGDSLKQIQIDICGILYLRWQMSVCVCVWGGGGGGGGGGGILQY